MFKRIFIQFLLTFLISTSIFSQELNHKKWKFTFQIDNRFSSIRNKSITIFGGKTGVQYKNLIRLGIGVSFIVNPVTIEYFNKKLKVQETNTLNFWYISVFTDLILYKSNNWEVFLTEQIGKGNPSLTKAVNDEIVADVNVGLFLNEVSGQVNYKINGWFGAGAGIGYRNLLNNNGRLKDTFEAPIYIVKLIIYPEHFFKN